MVGPNLRYALRIKNNARRGGEIEHVYCRRITIGQVYLSVLRIDFHYEEGSAGAHMPSVRHVRLEQLTCEQCPRIAEVHSFDNAVIAAILLKDSNFKHVAKRSIVENAPALALENVVVNGQNVIAV
jgi:hypothetical protein